MFALEEHWVIIVNKEQEHEIRNRKWKRNRTEYGDEDKMLAKTNNN